MPLYGSFLFSPWNYFKYIYLNAIFRNIYCYYTHLSTMQMSKDVCKNIWFIEGRLSFLSSHLLKVCVNYTQINVLIYASVFLFNGTSARWPVIRSLTRAQWVTNSNVLYSAACICSHLVRSFISYESETAPLGWSTSWPLSHACIRNDTF